LKQLSHQPLLVLDLYQIRHAIRSKHLNPLILIATEKQIAGEHRQKRPDFSAPALPNLPAHRKKIADVPAHQILSKCFLVTASCMCDPPQTGKLADRLALRPGNGRIVA
jgi:hypothetical protein